MEKPLAELMAQAARELQEQRAPSDTMEAAVALARAEIEGCDAAALSIVVRHRGVETLGATSAASRTADELQYQTGEGPCLDAIWQERTVHSTDLASDPRWPTWGPKVADEIGFRSMLAFRLFTSDDTLGALNLYGNRRGGFGVEDRDHGLALAAHIAVAVRSAQRIAQLDAALASRTKIALALGIIMERYQVDEDAAFAILTRLSSHTNRKLRDLAVEVVETRRLPGP